MRYEPRETRQLSHVRQDILARRWGISPRTLERWRWLGQGPAYLKVGGRVVYRLEDVEAYEAARRRATGEKGDEALSGPERFARGLPE